MANSESQENELLAMQSIYEEKEFVIDVLNPPSGRIIAEVRLPNEFYVRVTDEHKLSSSVPNISEEIFQVAHLPPIILSFRFPKTYPLQTCPAFLLSCNWLTLEQQSVLCKKLEDLWEISKDVILHTWMQFLQDKCLDFLNIGHYIDISDLLISETRPNFQGLSINNTKGHSSLKANENTVKHYKSIESRYKMWPSVSGGNGEIDSRVVNELTFGGLLIDLLKNYNNFKIKEVFSNSCQECSVCLLKKQGTEFIVFKDCDHFFCRSCVKDYYESQIRNGNVNSLKCLGQCETSAEASTVKDLVGVDLYEKYESLLLSSALDSMSDIAYCPRKECQCACVIDVQERMATCSACGFIFCPFCKMTFHGVAPCNFKSERQKSIFNEFINGNTATKKELEKRYGKRVIKSLVEDTLSESWKNSNSKSCPRCRTSIEKTDGCNKMTCYRCDSSFCWLCMKILKSSNPYSHYSDDNSECYNRLFPTELMLNGDADVQQEDLIPEFDDVQPGEYLNQDLGFQRGEYVDVDFGALLRRLLNRDIDVQPDENLDQDFGVQPEENLNQNLGVQPEKNLNQDLGVQRVFE